jgi:hypothetical protein
MGSSGCIEKFHPKQYRKSEVAVSTEARCRYACISIKKCKILKYNKYIKKDAP